MAFPGGQPPAARLALTPVAWAEDWNKILTPARDDVPIANPITLEELPPLLLRAAAEHAERDGRG